MYYYNCKVLLDGSRNNEVRLSSITAPEVLILRFIHGADCVLEIQEIKNEKVSIIEEKSRLSARYNSALVKKDRSVDKIFGDLGILPQRLPDQVLQQFNIDVEKQIKEVDVDAFKKAYQNRNISIKTEAKRQQQEENEFKPLPADQIDLNDLIG